MATNTLKCEDCVWWDYYPDAPKGEGGFCSALKENVEERGDWSKPCDNEIDLDKLRKS